jgi:hypothetical protein
MLLPHYLKQMMASSAYCKAIRMTQRKLDDIANLRFIRPKGGRGRVQRMHIRNRAVVRRYDKIRLY